MPLNRSDQLVEGFILDRHQDADRMLTASLFNRQNVLLIICRSSRWRTNNGGKSKEPSGLHQPLQFLYVRFVQVVDVNRDRLA